MKNKKTITQLLSVLVLFLSSCGSTPQKKEEPMILTLEQENLLNSLESDGYITLKAYQNEIWVEPIFWATCKYDAKHNLGLLGAVKCQQVNGNELYYCTIYDNRTGKKLAKWSRAWGFDVE